MEDFVASGAFHIHAAAVGALHQALLCVSSFPLCRGRKEVSSWGGHHLR